MKKYKFTLIKFIKKCWYDISFKDKGLIIIMFVLLLQCLHNLYNIDPTAQEYVTINVIIRTSVAGIFGYFLSSSFLNNSDDGKENPLVKEKLDLLDSMLQDSEIQDKLSKEFKCVNIRQANKDEKEQEEIYICNRNLQDAVALFICVFLLISLMIGINFNLIPHGSTATISQFRDLVSGCIGFLLGNRAVKNNGK